MTLCIVAASLLALVLVLVSSSIVAAESVIYLPQVMFQEQGTVTAASDPPDFAAGEACAFAMSVDGMGDWPKAEKVLTDEETGETLTLKPQGSVQNITVNPDGSLTVVGAVPAAVTAPPTPPLAAALTVSLMVSAVGLSWT